MSECHPKPPPPPVGPCFFCLKFDENLGGHDQLDPIILPPGFPSVEIIPSVVVSEGDVVYRIHKYGGHVTSATVVNGVVKVGFNPPSNTLVCGWVIVEAYDERWSRWGEVCGIAYRTFYICAEGIIDPCGLDPCAPGCPDANACGKCGNPPCNKPSLNCYCNEAAPPSPPPVDNCLGVVCGENAYCSGGYCYCNTGYEGDPYTGCTPIQYTLYCPMDFSLEVPETVKRGEKFVVKMYSYFPNNPGWAFWTFRATVNGTAGGARTSTGPNYVYTSVEFTAAGTSMNVIGTMCRSINYPLSRPCDQGEPCFEERAIITVVP